ncbi:pentapeptide repeat-containing protein [Streptomyces sp. NPDC005732]|uniref:pentapeptide repeat-containing protein n=1 Tax=Streptomyces sp. NPDC005732 TaxID=3157057 RepID=UPI003409EEAC
MPSHNECLAHLSDTARDDYLAGLAPGADIDHRGTSFSQPLLDAFLNAVRDPTSTHPRLGTADFDSATFKDDADFDSATFEGNAWFATATFEGVASFRWATFNRNTGFESATITEFFRVGSAV